MNIARYITIFVVWIVLTQFFLHNWAIFQGAMGMLISIIVADAIRAHQDNRAAAQERAPRT